jgi:ubiquitin carboxyl-terminal hydrolase 9/24
MNFCSVLIARSTDKNAHLWEYILEGVLNLLRRDVSEYGRHLVQYFNFFVSYANFGDEEKLHLINVRQRSNLITKF